MNENCMAVHSIDAEVRSKDVEYTKSRNQESSCSFDVRNYILGFYRYQAPEF